MNNITLEPMPKQLGSVARQLGRKTLTESLHSAAGMFH